METTVQILSVIGAVLLFLFGMRTMSEALQKLSGSRMRSVISKFTDKNSKGFLSGMFLTTLLQSSSATTLLIVGLVNAGVLNLARSIPLIIGANVGTTIKIWLISFLGFHFDISKYALIILLIGFPFIFFKRKKSKHLGDFIVGISLLFLGLFFMKTLFPEINENSPFILWAKHFSSESFQSIIIFIGIGFLSTAILQSSSATITLTFVLCSHKLIDFPLAAAMVLGENIGTTITANLGALVANNESKRAALSHFLMNFFMVLLILPFFFTLIPLISNILLNGFNLDMSQAESIPIGLTFIHTSFNIVLSLVMLPSISLLIRLCQKIIPVKQSEFVAKHTFDDRFFDSTEMALLHVRNEICLFAKTAISAVDNLPNILMEKKSKQFHKIFDEIRAVEEFSDTRRTEITNYLTRLSENELSSKSSVLITRMHEIADCIENITDICLQLSLTIENKNSQNAWFSQDMREEIVHYFALLQNASYLMLENLGKDYDTVQIDTALQLELELNELRTKYRTKYSKNKSNDIPFQANVYYNQIITLSERLGDLTFNVTRAIVNTKIH